MPPYTRRERVIEDLRRAIEDGTYRPGDRLPSGSQLCAQYGVSRQVVRSAIDYLKATGWVVGVPGSGVYVAER